MSVAHLRGRAGLVAMAIVAVVVAPLAWYLISPLFITTRVDERFPAGAAAGAAAAPRAVASGQFGVIDAVHRGEGTAGLFVLPDGRPILRLDDFRVTNGPDLFIYLSGHPAPRDSRQLHEGGALEVARLKGNEGGQNYDLPAEADVRGFKSVVIYCKRFGVVFSTAELGPAS